MVSAFSQNNWFWFKVMKDVADNLILGFKTSKTFKAMNAGNTFLF